MPSSTRAITTWFRPALHLLVASLGVACSSSASDSPTSGAPTDAGNSGTPVAEASVDAGTQCKATTVTGPITSGGGVPFTMALNNLAAVGYVEEEYFIEGDASAYDWKTPPTGADGPWAVKNTTTAHYKTRFLVRRPTDPTKFNGSVFVEWFNVSGGIDDDPDYGFAHDELVRGWAYVGVSAQAEGVVGGGLSLGSLVGGASVKPLVQWDPARYGSLKHPGDSYSYDMYTQVACALHNLGGAVKPFGALMPARYIGAGESQSAGYLLTYANAIQPVTKVFDGLFIHSRFGSGASLTPSGGLAGLLASSGPSAWHIRGDLTVPVFQFETETDVGGPAGQSGFSGARQPDTDRLRSWEVAGTSHADQYLLDYSAPKGGDAGADAGSSITSSCTSINNGPQHWVDCAAVAAFHTWLKDGTAPAHGDPLTLADAGTGFAKDAIGNSLGGVRTAAVDVPIDILSGTSSGGILCSLFGSTTPLPAAQLLSLYPTHDDYVSKVTAATNKAQEGGFILSTDTPAIVQEADAAPVPQ
jgi:hypothetical protein